MPRTHDNRRGSALVLSLIVVTVVAILSMALLNLNRAVTKRQAHNIDDMRAFYLAEAGLSEAYFGLMTGNSGQLGSIDAPALAGDGLVWVDAIEEEEGVVRLRSTGLCQAGRSTLEIVVRREQTPLGIFADEGIELTTPFLVDGYDAEASPYYEQAPGYGKLVLSPDQPFKYDLNAEGEMLLVTEEAHYMVVDYDLDTLTFYYSAVQRRTGGEWIAVGGQTDLDAAPTLSEPQTLEPIAPTGLGPTTGVGGVLGSNGPIVLSSNDTPIQIYGDIVPGVDQSTDLGWGVTVTGSSESREESLELAPVAVPDVDMLPGFVHDSAIPRVLPPAEVGYDSISVANGSELVVQGQGNLVVGDFLLQDGGAMTVENGTGPVNLYVTDSADLVTGSSVTVESNEPADLSLQAAASALALNLRATSQFHGMVYAPDSHVAVGRDFEIFGMLVGNTLEIDPMARLHFDSGVLGNNGAVPMPRLVSWRIEEIPAEVAQSRIDPFRLLNLNRGDLQDLTDAQEQVSWFVSVEHYAQKELQSTYDGPLELWGQPPGMRRSVFRTLTPPETSAGGWTIRLRYEDKNGNPKSYDGPVEGLGLPLNMVWMSECTVTEPAK